MVIALEISIYCEDGVCVLVKISLYSEIYFKILWIKHHAMQNVLLQKEKKHAKPV